MSNDNFHLPPIYPEEMGETKETKAITLRLNKSWITKLERIAFRMSDYYKVPITKQWLIKQVLDAHVIIPPFSETIRALGIVSERKQLKICKKILKQAT